MAKINAPLLSFGGSGQIGDAMVFSKWKGIQYVRRKVIPANPNSTGQQSTRNTFSFLNALYKFGGALFTAPWDAYAVGKPVFGRNAFLQTNLPLLRGQADDTAFEGSPGSNGGIIASSIATADAGGQAATVTLGVPSLPDGWTITDSIAVLIKNQDPESGTDYVSYEGSTGDATGVVTVNAAAGSFVASGWFKMTKADGTVAYGPSKTTTVVLA